MKKYKKELIISSLCTLIPMFIGLILWNKLPDTMPSHFGVSGEADAYSSKAFVVFVPTLIMLVANFICFSATMIDKKNRDQNPKVIKLILMIMPAISIFISLLIYASAFDIPFKTENFVFNLLGFTFIAVGNYMPKTKQNFTIGIKIKWTLLNEENWNKTHRFAGKVWVISGIIAICSILLPAKTLPYIIIVFLIPAFLPVIYSYLYYKKQIKEGTANENDKLSLNSFEKKTSKIAIYITVIILIGVIILLFSGDISYSFGETSLKIDATYWGDMEVSYSDIDSFEYRENFDFGSRTSGFGSFKLLMGQFENNEFSNFTLYAFPKCKSVVIINTNDTHVVINAREDYITKAFYETLLIKTGKE